MKRTIMMVAAVVIGLTAAAQTGLSGKWKRDSQESISGKLYVNGTPETMTISSDKKELTLEKVYVAGENTSSVKEVVKLNGNISESVTVSNRRKVMTYRKESEKFTVVSLIYDASDREKLDKRVTDIMVVADGRLVIDRKDENLANGETWQAKAIYVKQ